MCVCVSVESVNDGLFHTVELLIQNQTLSLVVDKGAPKSLGKLARPPSLEPNTHLYIGGESTIVYTTTVYSNVQKSVHPVFLVQKMVIHFFMIFYWVRTKTLLIFHRKIFYYRIIFLCQKKICILYKLKNKNEKKRSCSTIYCTVEQYRSQLRMHQPLQHV